jgi:hypothetical protein
MTITESDQLDLIQPDDKPGEWWVTLNGKAVIGFSGHAAQTRAERHFRQLLSIAARISADGDNRLDPNEGASHHNAHS